MKAQAIVGFDVTVLGCKGIDAFDRCLFTGEDFEQATDQIYGFEALEKQALALAKRFCLDISATCLTVLSDLALSDLPLPEPTHFKHYVQKLSLVEALTTLSDHETHIIATFSHEGIACLALSVDKHAANFGLLAQIDWHDTERLTQIGLLETTPDVLTDKAVNALSHSPSVTLSRLDSFPNMPTTFNDLLRLVKITLAAYQRYFPLVQDASIWPQDLPVNFITQQNSVPWFSHDKRFAAMSLTEGHLLEQPILFTVEEPESNDRPNGFFALSKEKLCLFSADNVDALMAKLDSIDVDQALADIAREAFVQFGASKPLRLSLIADSMASLIHEIALAKVGVSQALTQGGDWKTPKGSYFTAAPNPCGVCFMYPGIGASYIGLGRALFRLFPALWPLMEAKTYDLGNSLKDHRLHPKSLTPITFKETKALENALRLNLAEMAECGVAYSCVYTAIFRDVFKVSADFAAGYSMGEVSMFAALDVWQEPALMGERLENSHTFTRRLSGELLALDDAWGKSLNNDSDNSWQTFSIRATQAEVDAASEGLARVYCTIINTQDNLIIGGHPDDCRELLKRLGVKGMNLGIANAIHSPPAENDYGAMTTLYDLAVNDKIPTQIYSSSCYLPVPQFQKAIAHSIATCLCKSVDFPRLINALHNKGANVFIEMGPGRSLSSWVDKILPDKNTTSLCVNAKGSSDELTLLRALAKIVSHGVPIDLSCLYSGSLNKVLVHD